MAENAPVQRYMDLIPFWCTVFWVYVVNSHGDWKSDIYFLENSMKLLDMLMCLDIISCGNSCALPQAVAYASQFRFFHFDFVNSLSYWKFYFHFFSLHFDLLKFNEMVVDLSISRPCFITKILFTLSHHAWVRFGLLCG